MTHTPTPWGAIHSVGSTLKSYSQSSCVVGLGENMHKIICGCFDDIGGEDVANANASLIVRAVNSHAELVAALDGMMLLAEGSGIENFSSDDRAICERAKAALSRAKGTQ